MSDKLTILLIEDDPFLSSVLQLKLEKENFEVIRASDGEEALNLLLQQGVKPDLVLLDLILPKKNGFEVLETIRQEPTLEKLPVIIISNLGQPSDIERGKSLGVIDYFVKARLSIDELVNKVKEDVATNK
ncbi:MAG: Transcriptional regulatory protein AfsQ1 [Parcubacteria group bacterium ADurb.Bin305]|mgnify:CR=1 FL=1|jgi:DNA-binding response OmpR family regulator|nr:response regulator [Candidatus Paceibacterota bacterium]MDD3434789.1 response regulator [Candidatus Paceibacterota bacterium]OQA43279.1 MAG: Transcriptional regulatory protein AfsQ1 [Parcubacteria group bacterium ADurb.Bin305]